MDENERKQLIAQLKAAIAEGVADTDAVKSIVGRLNEIEQKLAEAPTKGKGRGIGVGIESLLATDTFRQRLKAVAEDGMPNTGSIHLPGVTARNLKALVSGGGGTVNSPDNSFPSLTERGPIVTQVQRPLSILELLPRIPVKSNSFEHVRLSKLASAAAVQQSEGDQKAEMTVVTELVTSPIATLAVFTIASVQVLSDNPQLGDMVRSILLADLLDKLESMIVAGTGTNGEFTGLLSQAVPITGITAGNPADELAQAQTIMAASGYTPSLVVVSHNTWNRIRTERATGGNEQYVAGGWANPSSPSVWNMPLVQTSSIGDNEALIIDSARGARILDREQVAVAISREDRDNFVKNMVTMLAEGRFGLAVLDDGAVGKVELST